MERKKSLVKLYEEDKEEFEKLMLLLFTDTDMFIMLAGTEYDITMFMKGFYSPRAEYQKYDGMSVNEALLHYYNPESVVPKKDFLLYLHHHLNEDMLVTVTKKTHTVSFVFMGLKVDIPIPTVEVETKSGVVRIVPGTLNQLLVDTTLDCSDRRFEKLQFRETDKKVSILQVYWYGDEHGSVLEAFSTIPDNLTKAFNLKRLKDLKNLDAFTRNILKIFFPSFKGYKKFNDMYAEWV